uniref:Putative secreted protein 54 n=1 Tax=Amblyomma americanum TaxID=6943 RepID=A0A0C9R6B3_AMBAM
MRAFLVVCLLSAVCLANARGLVGSGRARARAGGRVFAGAEERGPSGFPGVTYTLGGNFGGHISGNLGTGLDGTGFGNQWGGYGSGFSGPWSSGFYPFGNLGYYPENYGFYGNNGWGSNYGLNGFYGAPWANQGYGYGFYPQFGSGYDGNFRNNGWNTGFGRVRRGAGPALVASGPAGASLAAAGAAAPSAASAGVAASGPSSTSP